MILPSITAAVALAIVAAALALRPAPMSPIEWSRGADGSAACGGGTVAGEPLREAIERAVARRAPGSLSAGERAALASYLGEYLSAVFTGRFECVAAVHRAHGGRADPELAATLREHRRAMQPRFRPPGWERWTDEQMVGVALGGTEGRPWSAAALRGMSFERAEPGARMLQQQQAGGRREPGPWPRFITLPHPATVELTRLGAPQWRVRVRGVIGGTGEAGLPVEVEVTVARLDVEKFFVSGAMVLRPDFPTPLVGAF